MTAGWVFAAAAGTAVVVFSVVALLIPFRRRAPWWTAAAVACLAGSVPAWWEWASHPSWVGLVAPLVWGLGAAAAVACRRDAARAALRPPADRNGAGP
jgi:hypothetical protein